MMAVEVPECLNGRYEALDQLIRDLNYQISSRNYLLEQPSNTSNVGIKLMCDFWNILKDDPECNLTREVQNLMGISSRSSPIRNPFNTQQYFTYMAGKQNCGEQNRDANLSKGSCCSGSKSRSKPGSSAASQAASYDNIMPLSKALCNIKEAASLDKKCHARVNELMEAQTELTKQIQILEDRERDQVQKLKEADCMWLCMEEEYKKKIAESVEKQKELLKELKKVEANANKWKKNRKEMEFEIQNMNRLKIETTERLNQKKNDTKVMETEIANLEKRKESNKKDIEHFKKGMTSKKAASDDRMAKIAAETVKVQNLTQIESNNRKKKEEEGTQYVKDAREDLQKLCRVLLQKKLENEDLRAERAALQEEIGLLQTTFNTCKEKCKSKEQTIIEECAKLSTEIAEFKVKCVKCHVCVDTSDVRRLCTDCPRCLKQRECIYGNDSCNIDPTMDCVCMSVKQKFLDNVFDNMYTVLERQSKTDPGKAVADAILNSLKRSRNGKLSLETRKILQDFILTTVKKNLNLTIVGGAVKTRCEMDRDTYKQLMLCLKEVTVVKPPKHDMGTASRKDPCERWGGTNECNCPKGPKNCICTKKAPPPPNDPTPCPQDKEDIGETKACPYNEPKVCGPDCGMQGKPHFDASPRDVAAWRPDPCSGQSCPYTKNMRAAQCMIGVEPLRSIPQYGHNESSCVDKMVTCRCSGTPRRPCPCPDCKRHPRQRIIEEVIGSYTDDSSLEKLSYTAINNDSPDIKLQTYIGQYGSLCVKPETYINEQSKDKLLSIQPNNYSILNKGTSLYADDKLKCHPNTITSFHTLPIQKEVSKLFKMASDSNSGQINNNLTAMAKSSLGQIENKNNEQTTTVNVSLKKTVSEQSIVYFGNYEIKASEIQKGIIKKSSPEKTVLQIHKSLVNTTTENNNVEKNLKSMHSGVSFNKINRYHDGTVDEKNNKYKKQTVDKFDVKIKPRGMRTLEIRKNTTNKIKNTRQQNSTGNNFSHYIPNKHNCFSSSVVRQENIKKITENTSTVKKGGSYNLSKGVLCEDIGGFPFPQFIKKDKASHTANESKMKLYNDSDKVDESQIKEPQNTVTRNLISPEASRMLKLRSDNIKKVLNEPLFEPTCINTSNINLRRQAQMFEDSFSSLGQDTNKRSHNKYLRKSKTCIQKAISDTELYVNKKLKLKVKQNMLYYDPLAIMKRTESGQYAIILRKESKKSFLDHLRSHLVSNSRGLVSVKITDSGETLIDLEGKTHEQKGCLKVTRSGNIFLILDSETVKNIISESKDNNQSFHLINITRSEQYIDSVKIVVEKTCKERPVDCIYDISNCVCEELQTETITWKSDIVSDVSNNRQTLTISQENKSPHIVIKPASEYCSAKDVFGTTEACYYIIETVCSYHKYRYSGLSNELLEISGLCNKVQGKFLKKIEFVSNTRMDICPSVADREKWDSLNYLPPQLPPFLRNFNYR